MAAVVPTGSRPLSPAPSRDVARYPSASIPLSPPHPLVKIPLTPPSPAFSREGIWSRRLTEARIQGRNSERQSLGASTTAQDERVELVACVEPVVAVTLGAASEM